MKRQKTLMWMVAGAVFVLAVTVFVVRAVRHHAFMQQALAELQAANQAGTVFGSDSAAQVLVDYFDEPWHRRNDRVLAHYLLGRAHADMGEAPQAIEDYQTAIECADTTDEDCDLYVLSAVYGQMAEVYHAQNLPEDEIEAQKMYNHLSWMNGDTLYAIEGFRSLECPYYLLGEHDRILEIDSLSRCQFLIIGETAYAARSLLAASNILTQRRESERAKKYIDIIRLEADIFNEDQQLIPGHEMFYYTLGLYFDGINQLDSAEYYYRQLLPSKEYEAAYRGLLSVYTKRGIADSIAKFAPLYADANDAYHDTLRTAEVHKTASLYNYNRHLRIAKEEQRKSQGRLIALYITIIAILALVITCYYLYAKNLERERKREHALNTIRENYYEVNAAYLRLMQESEDNKNSTELVKQKLEELQSQQEQLDLLSSSLKEKNKVGYYYSHDIVQGVIDAAICGKRLLAGKVLIQLQALFAETFPHFTIFVEMTHDLTDIEWYVCILMDLGLSNSDIAFLTGYTTSRISNIKVQISHNLFHEDSSMALLKNLRAKIHPISSKV